jgi:uncharacterized membrane protein
MKMKMKMKIPIVLVMLLVFFFGISNVYALNASQEVEPVLTADQIVVVGLVATILLNVLRLAYEFAAKQKFAIPELGMQAIVMIVSGVLAYLWYPLILPIRPVLAGADTPTIIQLILKYVSDWIILLGAFFAVSHFFYRLLIKRIKDGLGAVIVPKVYPAGQKLQR